MRLDAAVRLLREKERPEMADIYALAGDMRHQTEHLFDLAAGELSHPE